MFDKVKQMMEMKKQADEIKKQLDAIEIEVHEVRGIKILITGSQTFKSIDIEDKHLAAGNKDRFQKDLTRSLNEAIKKSQFQAAMKMKTLMPNGFPGM